MAATTATAEVCPHGHLDPTRRVLRQMLRERTGSSILDSGGEAVFDGDGRYIGSRHGYGRNFERNRGRHFEAEPEATVSFRHGEIAVTLNIYHWLAVRLTYNEEEDNRFVEWSELPDNADESWLANVESYLDHLKTTAVQEASEPPAGIYGDGEPVTVNTYNGEDLLSQTLQYVYWTDDRGAHVLLQIHGGCDVRGGYTRPRYFDVTGDDETCILDNARATIACENDVCGAHWTTDDGCHWYDDGTCGRGYVQLETYEKIEAGHDVFAEADAIFNRLVEDEERQGSLFPRSTDDVLAKVAAMAGCLADETEDDTPERAASTLVEAMAAGKGLLRYTEDGAGFCPKCRVGRLVAHSW